jgi:hypothetical protein
MAVPENKRFTRSAQPRARKARKKPSLASAPTRNSRSTRNTQKVIAGRNPKKPKKRETLPPSLRYTETRRGKTTIRRFNGRSIYRLEEIKGKPVDCIEIFDSGDDHSISVRFQDKTSISFSIEPGFNLFTDYADWKTGNWRCIKRWPPIRSAD